MGNPFGRGRPEAHVHQVARRHLLGLLPIEAIDYLPDGVEINPL